LRRSVTFAIEIADALDAAHRRGMEHWDLKPRNIMVTLESSKLLDFGLANVPDIDEDPNAPAATEGTELTEDGAVRHHLVRRSPVRDGKRRFCLDMHFRERHTNCCRWGMPCSCAGLSDYRYWLR
jgi:serine/threonine protein kinase